MKARHILGHLFLVWTTFFSVLIGMAGIEEFGLEWMWIAMFFFGAFILGFQACFLLRKLINF